MFVPGNVFMNGLTANFDHHFEKISSDLPSCLRMVEST